VALHQAEYITGADVREGLVVTNNIFDDTGTIRLLGARMFNVGSNIMRRTKNGGVQVFYDALEGEKSAFGGIVAFNQFYDTIERQPSTSPAVTVIYIASAPPRGSAATSNIIPGQANPATGVFVQPYAWRNTSFDAGEPVAQPHSLLVFGNIIKRTLPSVAAYSSWGYGQSLSGTGWIDPAISEAELRPNVGLFIDADFRLVQIAYNTISHIASGIYVDAALSNYNLDNWSIETNTITEFTNAGVDFASPVAARTAATLIARNTFDGDPYHVHPNRGAAGAWATNDLPIAIATPGYQGVRIEENRIRNVCSPYFNVFVADCRLKDNVLRCQPAALGFSTSNKGIGEVLQCENGYTYDLVNCDPTSASFGSFIDGMALFASGMPTSGLYVAGHFVKNVNRGLTHFGYVRQTTGTGHTPTVDWKTVAAT
jgi:hypothetical protein